MSSDGTNIWERQPGGLKSTLLKVSAAAWLFLLLMAQQAGRKSQVSDFQDRHVAFSRVGEDRKLEGKFRTRPFDRKGRVEPTLRIGRYGGDEWRFDSTNAKDNFEFVRVVRYRQKGK